VYWKSSAGFKGDRLGGGKNDQGKNLHLLARENRGPPLTGAQGGGKIWKRDRTERVRGKKFPQRGVSCRGERWKGENLT